jgi:hypothetical protein
MDLSTLLSLVGSIASIGAIPLSIWLYLRAQEEKLANTRREILRILSYQLGEARPLSLFEIRAVIDSTLRAKRLKAKSITPGQIIDDLVTETIANPMLAPERKQLIIAELERVLLAPPIRDILSRHRIRGHELLALLRESGLATRADMEMPPAVIEMEADEIVDAEGPTRRQFSSSTAFGVLAAITSVVAVAVQFGERAPRIRDFFQHLPAQSFFLGLVASVAAALLTVLYERLALSTKGRKHGGKARPRGENDEPQQR